MCSALLTQVPTDDELSALVRQDKLLPALVLAEQRARAARDPRARQQTGQALATVRTYVGDTLGAARLGGEVLGAFRQPNPGAVDPRVERLERVPAVTGIVEASAGHAFVVLNENHVVGQNRAFATLLLEALARAGFHFFAAEGLTRSIAQSVDAGVPFADGANVMPDPLYADLVRTALRLGMVLVPYDDSPPLDSAEAVAVSNHREAEGAKNVIAATLTKDPRARVFVFCGFNHVGERPLELAPGQELVPLAARLGALSGEKVLTVDQATMVSTGFERWEQPAYRFAKSRPWLTQPVLLREKNEWFRVDLGEDTDLQVVLPRTTVVRGRPQWLFEVGHRRPVDIPARARPQRGRLLLRAFLAAEPAPAVPLDQVLLTAGDTTTALALRPGRYALVSQDEAGTEVDLGPLLVKD